MEQDFELKHRLVGAAVLIFFGVLVLPWWLSPPASELPEDAVVEVARNPDLSSSSPIAADVALEPDLLEALMAEQANTVDGEEQVLVSRITPLDEGATPDNDQAASLEAKSVANEGTKVSLPTAKSAEKQQDAPAKANNAPAPVAVNTTNQKSTQSGAVDAESAEIDVGWAVQVGVFTDKIGAGKVVDDLKAKGFNPKTSTVDTNKGPKTGTRVWLGPYEARVDAAKAKANLTEKTGEPGFIRSFP